MNWSAIGAVVLGLSVAFGAFGAHGLRERLDDYSLSVYEKAVFYQFIHGIALLVIPLLAKAGVMRAAGASRACWFLITGILIFSGSLYLLSLTGVRALGAITPFGGAAFLAGWGVLAWELLRYRSS